MKYMIAFLLPLLMISGCAKEIHTAVLQDPVPDQVMPAEAEGLSIELPQNVFTDSPDTIEVIVHNLSGSVYQLGTFYHIERKIDGLYHIITYSDAVFLNNPDFRDFGIFFDHGESLHQTFSVDLLGVKLQPGDYRLVKTFLATGEAYHEVAVAAPFSVKD